MIFRFFSLVTVFLAVFFIAGILLNSTVRQFLPRPYMGLLSEKLDVFEEHSDEIDIVFLGTSRTYRQVDALYLESRLEEQGCDGLNVYNFGVQNLTYVELLYILRHIFADNPERLKLIVTGEPMPGMRKLSDIRSDRTRYFSDITGSLHRVHNIITYQESVWKKLARLILAGGAFAYEQSNLGHLSRLVFPEVYAANNSSEMESPWLPQDWYAVRGYHPLNAQAENHPAMRERYERFRANNDHFVDILARQRSDPPKPAGIMPSRVNLYMRLMEEMRDKAITPGVFLPPLPDRTSENMALAQVLKENKTGAPVLFYNNPEQYPEFWDVALWFDKTHLGEDGARLLTAKLAAPICRAIKGKP